MSFIPSRLARAHGMLWLIACAALALPAQAQTDTGSSPRKAASTKKAPAKKSPAKPAAAPAAAAPAAVAPAPVASAPAPAPVSSAPREADFIVAVVNREPLTNHEVRARMARAQRQLDGRGQGAPSSEVLRKEMLERLIAERAQLQYAREHGLKVDDAALALSLIHI